MCIIARFIYNCAVETSSEDGAFIAFCNYVKSTPYHATLPSYLSGSENVSAVVDCHTKFLHATAQFYPELRKHVQGPGNDFDALVLRWLRIGLTDFALLKPSTVMRVWDLYMAHDWTVFARCLWVILEDLQTAIYQSQRGFEVATELLMNMPGGLPETYFMEADDLFRKMRNISWRSS